MQSGLILLYRKYRVVINLKSADSYRAKKRSAVDRTAAEWNYVAHATRRRRRILLRQDSFYKNNYRRIILWQYSKALVWQLLHL